MGDESEWMKLPTDEKCVHKVWKARVAGYTAALKTFQTEADEKSPEFSKYQGLIKKFVVDSNAVAQEKGLEATLAFVDRATVAPRTAGEVCSGVVTKCLNSARTRTRELGAEILLMYIEIEKQDVVQETLIGGLSNKQPKIVSGCVNVMTEALRCFGNKIFPIKPLVKHLSPLLEDRDRTVRESGKALVVEMYRWIGAALRPQLTSLKPVQLSELEGEFEALGGEKGTQLRFLRSQQDLKEQHEAGGGATAAAGGAAGVAGGDDEVEDLDDLIAPVEILSRMPKDFFDKIEAKKWQERKEALEAVQKLADAPKLEPGDYGDLVRALKKVVAKDTNVMLVVLAAKVLALLAKGLRKKFQPYAVQVIDACLEKFKEKKTNVVAALHEAIDAAFVSTTFEPISEQVVASLEHKTPSMKLEAAKFLARSFAKSTMQTLPKKMLKLFCSALLKTINDTDATVRDASLEALGTAMKVVGEKPMQPFIADIDNIKMAKLKECCENAVLLKLNGEPRTTTGGVTSAAPAASQAGATARETTKPAVIKKATQPQTRPRTAPAKAGGPPPAKKKGTKKKLSTEPELPGEALLTDEAVDEKANELLSAETVTHLISSNWKERLSACEAIWDRVKPLPVEDLPVQVLLRVLCRKPGLKDTNFQVLKLKVDLTKFLAQFGDFTKTSAEVCLRDLADKIGDVKNGAAVAETLSCIAEATTLQFVSDIVIAYSFNSQKNPKNQSEALLWLNRSIREFGLKVDVKGLVQYLKIAFAHTNPAVRTSAIAVLGTAYLGMGPTARVFFEDEKPALLQQIDAEIERVKDERIVPFRGFKKRLGAAGDGADGGNEEEDEAAEVDVADLVPRNNISSQFTEELLAELSEKNWKVRNEALQKVTSIIQEAKFITADLGDLPPALKARLSDSNKLLITATLNICLSIATAMGPQIKQHVRTLGAGAVDCLGDAKPQIRQAARTALNAFVEQKALRDFVEAEIFSDALKKESPLLRAELCSWLTEVLPDAKKLPAELNLCNLSVLQCLEDRNADVRKKSQDLVLPLMVHVGYGSMHKEAGKLKASSKDNAIKVLEAARANLPAKPEPSRPDPPKAEAKAKKGATPPPEEVPADSAAKQKAVRGGKSAAAKKAPATSGKKKEEEMDISPALRVSNKDQRFKDERNLKVLKWNFTAPRPEFLEQLQIQMEPCFNKSLLEFCFHHDFKFHIRAIDMLKAAVTDLPEPTVSNLDLILKWMSLRFFDTNTTVLLKVLEYQVALFTMLEQLNYRLQEQEATSFVPYLVNKVGDPKDAVRKEVRSIFKLICQVYPASKLFSYVITGIASKNAKQRTECLEELGLLIDVHGINVCQPSVAQALKDIAKQIADRDNGVRSAALNTIVSAYKILGDNVYKYIGQLKDKEQGYLEERIKRSATRPVSQPGVTSGPPSAKTSPDEKKKPHTRPSTAPEPITASRRAESRLQLEDADDIVVQSVDLEREDDDDIINAEMALPQRKAASCITTPDAKSAIDLVISQVASTDVTTCLQALYQIDTVIQSEEKAPVFQSHVDQFLISASMQLRMTYSKQENEVEPMRVYKLLLGCLAQLFQTELLPKRATRDVLKDLVFNLLTVVTDHRLEQHPDSAQLIRATNILIVKMIEHAETTAVMSALIRLLHDSVSHDTATPKVDLIMKAIWKWIRLLPTSIKDLNLEVTLVECNNFMTSFPPSYWSGKQDTPLRTIRTVIHSLTKLRGHTLTSHMGLIEDAEHCELMIFLQKIYKLGGNVGDTPKVDAKQNGQEKTPPKPDPAKLRRSVDSSHALAEIFRKIGSKELTNELKYPDADVRPFLKRSSQFFQNYVERGLKSIALEREGKTVVASESVRSVSTVSPVTVEGNATSCKDRLKEEAKNNASNTANSASTPLMTSSTAMSAPPKTEPLNNGGSSRLLGASTRSASSDRPPAAVVNTDVDNLRRRLELIKKNATN